ncbi:hypothetical protein D3C86_2235830 [compost metagenome]
MDDGVVFGTGLGEKTFELELMLTVGDRAEFGALIQWRANVQFAQALGQFVHDRIDLRAMGEEAFGGSTDLPGV